MHRVAAWVNGEHCTAGVERLPSRRAAPPRQVVPLRQPPRDQHHWRRGPAPALASAHTLAHALALALALALARVPFLVCTHPGHGPHRRRPCHAPTVRAWSGSGLGLGFGLGLGRELKPGLRLGQD